MWLNESEKNFFKKEITKLVVKKNFSHIMAPSKKNRELMWR